MTKMVTLAIAIFLWMPLTAIAITEEQCRALGGAMENSECYRKNEGDSFPEGTETRPPTMQECTEFGGSFINGECVVKMGKKECEEMGGLIGPGGDCAQAPTKTECEAAGGTYQKDGQCGPITQR